MLQRFYDEANGAFFDVEKDPEAVGALKIREKPLPENVSAALGMLRLSHAAFDPEYREVARTTLSAYVEANREYGEFAASYARAVDLFLSSPVEITVEGDPENAGAQRMLKAAARIPYPHLIVKSVAVMDPDQVARAHVCLETLCLPPVSDPHALAGLVAGMTDTRESPFGDVLQPFTGF